MDAVLAAPGAVGAVGANQGRRAALGRPPSLPEGGVRPRSVGGHGGRA